MRHALFIASILVLALMPVSPLHAQCDNRPECGIRFLDDLLAFPRGTSNRDPYEERMETERHDFTQSSTTVGRGVFQVETGYLYSYKDASDEIEQAHATPETMLRLGLSDDIEFRLRWNYVWTVIDGEPHEEGAADLLWSFKLQVTEQEGFIPESALEIRSTAPTGGSAFSLGSVQTGLDYIYKWELNEDFAFYGSTSYSPGALGEPALAADDPDDWFTVYGQSAALGIELTENNSMYTEWFTLISDGLEDNFVQSYFNIGIDHYFTDNFLIDFRVGTGLTGDSEDFFAGVGGGVRF